MKIIISFSSQSVNRDKIHEDYIPLQDICMNRRRLVRISLKYIRLICLQLFGSYMGRGVDSKKKTWEGWIQRKNIGMVNKRQGLNVF